MLAKNLLLDLKFGIGVSSTYSSSSSPSSSDEDAIGYCEARSRADNMRERIMVVSLRKLAILSKLGFGHESVK
jgi:hypothetical protein